jgi:HK97 family phage portal protein
MKVFGYELSLRRTKAQTLNGVDNRGWHVIQESFGGAWQRDVVIDKEVVLSNWTVFACMTLIAGDVGKMCINLMQDVDGIDVPISSPAFSPVLRKPNGYQTRQKFMESWILSKLSSGNTYVLKERDNRGVVIAMHVLDPSRVRPLVAKNGDVYYELQDDELAGLPEGLPAIPASEIIHDRMWCLYHPLVGLSPIFACGLAAMQGLKIQGNSAKFFENMSRPSGILTAPGEIKDEYAQSLKENWEKNFGGDKMGRVAVLSSGLKYEAMSVNPIDSQLVDQLKLSGEMVCSVFHVPGYKVGVGPTPTYQNAEVLNQIYYADCIQTQIEGIEALLDDGLGIGNAGYSTEFDLDDLIRMDSATQVKTLNEAVGGGWMSPNEARKKRNLPSVKGGDGPYLQQQNYSLEALAKRDAGADPFATAKPAPAAAPSAAPAEDQAKAIFDRARAEIAEEMREQKAAEERFAREFTNAVVRELDGIGT